MEEPTHLAVATNSESVRLFSLATLSCTTSLVGHRDIVLCLDAAVMRTQQHAAAGAHTMPDASDASGLLPSSNGAAAGSNMCVLASGAKDHAVRVWDSASGRCIGLGVGHVGAVTSVAFSKKALSGGDSLSAAKPAKAGRPGAPFLVSVGADKLLKVWDLAPALSALALQAASAAEGEDGSQLAEGSGNSGSGRGLGAPAMLQTLAAVAAHDKDINAVAVSPNDAMVATASQVR